MRSAKIGVWQVNEDFLKCFDQLDRPWYCDSFPRLRGDERAAVHP
jgi:hypothetical protein